jgi:hypothetical protein
VHVLKILSNFFPKAANDLSLISLQVSRPE